VGAELCSLGPNHSLSPLGGRAKTLARNTRKLVREVARSFNLFPPALPFTVVGILSLVPQRFLVTQFSCTTTTHSPQLAGHNSPQFTVQFAARQSPIETIRNWKNQKQNNNNKTTTLFVLENWKRLPKGFRVGALLVALLWSGSLA